MTQTPINWNDLLLDVTMDVRNGKDLDQSITEVARDYDANPIVLRARFDKAYPNGVMAPVDMAAKVEETIQNTCERYGVPRSAVLGKVRTTVGRTVYVVCHTSNRYVVVDAATAEVRLLGFGCITTAAAKLAKAA